MECWECEEEHVPSSVGRLSWQAQAPGNAGPPSACLTSWHGLLQMSRVVLSSCEAAMNLARVREQDQVIERLEARGGEAATECAQLAAQLAEARRRAEVSDHALRLKPNISNWDAHGCDLSVSTLRARLRTGCFPPVKGLSRQTHAVCSSS